MEYKNKIKLILQYLLGGIGFVIVLPFAIIYFLLGVFWYVFGSSIIAFIILTLMGATMEECLQYSAGLGFLIGIYMKYRELKNKNE